jgi:hypothetical protein
MEPQITEVKHVDTEITRFPKKKSSVEHIHSSWDTSTSSHTVQFKQLDLPNMKQKY